MGFLRTLVGSAKTLLRPMRQGDGILANIKVHVDTTAGAKTLTVDQISGGAINYTGLSAGVNFTTTTAALILAAFPDMDIGDSFSFLVSIQDAFAGTWVAGVGVTLGGRTTTPASSWSWVVVTKTSDTAVSWTVL